MLEIRTLSLSDASALSSFLGHIQRAGEDRFFHPHEFSTGAIALILGVAAKDIYAGAIREGEVVAYGMLRGWDAGYTIPSLGIAVAPHYRGCGFGQLMMLYLHCSAQLRQASTIRLKVHHSNFRAKQLYEQLGYEFVQQEGEEDIGFLDLKYPRK